MSSPGAKGLLQPIKTLLEDDQISEIIINYPGKVFYEKNGTFNSANVSAFNMNTLQMLFQLIARENSQIINEQQPLLSGSLYDGSRVQLVLPPVATSPALSIRRYVLNKVSLDDYAEQGMLENINALPEKISQTQMLRQLYHDKQWLAFFKLALLSRKNIVISGGTSSGKTTFLNACIAQIPQSQRLIFLEDTRELQSAHENKLHLLSSKGGQTLAQVSMQDLLQCSLRLRPDRIICGEIRGKEISDFIAACLTGHPGSMTTIHASSPKLAFMRMVQMYKLNNVPSMSDHDILTIISTAVDIVIQLNRNENGRNVDQVFYKP
jgi:type IV secretion system protein VirB11